MTTRLSRERATTRALHDLHTNATELARYASKAAQDGATATCVGVTMSGADVESSSNTTSSSHPNRANGPATRGLRAARLAARRARVQRRSAFSSRRRIGAVLWAIVLVGVGSASLVSSAATASPDPAANSVYAFGAAPALGSEAGLDLSAGVVGMASDPRRAGYWLVAADGGVFAFGHAKFLGSTGGTTLNAPVVAIAATPNGRGYWLAGADGGVFAFGDAKFLGSMGGTHLAAPIAAIIATHDGKGYWLVGADGGVFAFGDAKFLGSAESLHLASPIVDATATHSGSGYWLLGADGGVFSFGDAPFEGALPDAAHPAVGIAAAPGDHGYWIAHGDGSVSGFDTTLIGNHAMTTLGAGHAQTVGIAANPRGGYWIAQGAPAAAVVSLASDPFLACTRAHESDTAGGYQAVSSGGTYRGAYQFDRSTWDSAARAAGRPDLVGVDPAAAAPADQDLLALTLFHERGAQPWGGRCSGMV